MRADAGDSVESGGAPPCQESVAAETDREPRGPLQREIGLRAEGDGAVVEEIVGGDVGGGGVELDGLRKAGSNAVRSVESGAVVEGEHRVPAQLVRDAEIQSLSAEAVVISLGIVREAAGIVQADPGVLPGVEAAYTEADRDAITGIVDEGALGVHSHTVQPGIVASIYCQKRAGNRFGPPSWTQATDHGQGSQALRTARRAGRLIEERRSLGRNSKYTPWQLPRVPGPKASLQV